MQRQAEHEADAAALGGEREQTLGVGGEGLAGDGFDAGGEPAVGVGGGDADGLGADVEAEQRAARRQVSGGLADGDDYSWHATVFRIASRPKP